MCIHLTYIYVHVQYIHLSYNSVKCDVHVHLYTCISYLSSSPLCQFMVGYEDSQLGAPDEEEEEEEEELDPSTAEPPGSGRGKEGAMVRSDYDKLLLESAVDEFEKNFADNFPQ